MICAEGLETGRSYFFLNLLLVMRWRYTGTCIGMADAKRKWPGAVSGKV